MPDGEQDPAIGSPQVALYFFHLAKCYKSDGLVVPVVHASYLTLTVICYDVSVQLLHMPVTSKLPWHVATMITQLHNL